MDASSALCAFFTTLQVQELSHNGYPAATDSYASPLDLLHLYLYSSLSVYLAIHPEIYRMDLLNRLKILLFGKLWQVTRCPLAELIF